MERHLLGEPKTPDSARPWKAAAIARRRRAASGVWTLCLVVGLASCSPYVNPEVPRPGLLRNESGDIELDAEHRMVPLHVTTGEAREYARLLQDAYRCKLREMSAGRTSTNAALISTAAAAIGIAATGGATAAVTALGLGGASMAAMGQQLVVSTRRTIYSQGGLALECVINAANTNVAPDTGAAGVLAAQASVIQSTERLNEWIRHARRVDRPGACATENVALDVAIGTGQEEAVRAEAFAKSATSALDALDPLGPILLSAVENIRLRVDEELSKAEPDLLDFNQALKDQLQSAAATYGMPTAVDGAAAGIMDRVTPMDVLRLQQPFVAPPACEEVAVATHEVELATLATISATSTLSSALTLARARPPVPADIFTSCSLLRTIGAGPLRIDPAVVKVEKKTKMQLLAVVSGGRKPYQTVPEASPKDVTTTLGTSTDASQTLNVSIPSVDTTGQFVIAVKDGDGTTALMIVQITDAAAGAVPGGGGAAAPVVVLPPPPPPSDPVRETLREAEDVLVASAYLFPGVTFGPADGVWDAQTRAAAVTFVRENAEVLSSPPDDPTNLADYGLAVLVLQVPTGE